MIEVSSTMAGVCKHVQGRERKRDVEIYTELNSAFPYGDKTSDFRKRKLPLEVYIFPICKGKLLNQNKTTIDRKQKCKFCLFY